MNWKLKATLMGLLARLPEAINYQTYYAIQRVAGGLTRLDPVPCLKAGVAMARGIGKYRTGEELGTFLEIGTGRHLSLPIALWLCGATKVITVDLNPFLEEEMVRQCVRFLKTNDTSVRSIFGDYCDTPLFRERFLALTACPATLASVMAMANIDYLAPADAQFLDLPDHAVDHHVSYTVFEHIPPRIILGIMKEGKRVVRPGGIFYHLVDFADHFSYADKAITTVNFLQFSDDEWDRWANNRYAYHNRLRCDEFLDLLSGLDLRILSSETYLNQRSLETLRAQRLPLDDRFKGKSEETNATAGMCLIATYP